MKPGPKINYDRRQQNMALLFRQGMTMDAIGKEYGVCRERVRQILNNITGHNRYDGGVYLTAVQKRQQALHSRAMTEEAEIISRYGCTMKEYHRIMKGQAFKMSANNPAYCYQQFKRFHILHKTPFDLSFPAWWRLRRECLRRNATLVKTDGNAFMIVMINRHGPCTVKNLRVMLTSEMFHRTNLKHGRSVGLHARRKLAMALSAR